MFQNRENSMTVRMKFISTRRLVAVTIVLIETNRKEKVRHLIEQFASYPNSYMLPKDFEKSEEIKRFSQESKDLIAEMGINEIFEFYETSSKI